MPLLDKFEYKGRDISVLKGEDGVITFQYEECDETIILPLEDLQKFVNGPFSNTTIGNQAVDMIEKSVKVNNFIYSVKDLKSRLKKYS
jgi:hypothetical protein